MAGPFYFLRIEIDGHFHGGAPVKPWVAEITGACPRYGLQRNFMRPMNDWKDASRAMSGNLYGVVATYPLREGRLYEVQRCEGNPSKRRVVRRFIEIRAGKQNRLTPLEALAHVDGFERAIELRLREPEESQPVSVSHVRGFADLAPQGFVLVDQQRHYRLVEGGVYSIVEGETRRLVGARDGKVTKLSEQEAWAWLTSSAA